MKIWLNFGFFDGKKVGKYKYFFRLKYLDADLCLSWVAPFYTTELRRKYALGLLFGTNRLFTTGLYLKFSLDSKHPSAHLSLEITQIVLDPQAMFLK